MGNVIHTYKFHANPGEYPYDHSPLEFDPLYGFPEGARKKKEAGISFAEIESAQIPPEYRSFCAKKILDFKECSFYYWPLRARCAPQLHAFHDCLNEELKDRLKDYEREKRLIQRRNRIRRVQAERRKLEGSPEAA